MFSPNRNPFTRPPKKGNDRSPSKSMTPEAKRRLWTTVAITAILLLVWFGSMAVSVEQHNVGLMYTVMTLYFVAFAVILVVYLAYNRGFVNKDVTEDMLPADWSEERKHDFVEGNRRRAEKSRWMVMLIIPFATVFLVEALYLFVWDGWFSGLLS